MNVINISKIKKGFTLIELLVTMTIVGIIASLGVANFNEYKARASDMKAILYAKDFEKIAYLVGVELESGIINPSAQASLNCFRTGSSSGAFNCSQSNTNVLQTMQDLLEPYSTVEDSMFFSLTLSKRDVDRSFSYDIISLHCKGKTHYSISDGALSTFLIDNDPQLKIDLCELY